MLRGGYIISRWQNAEFLLKGTRKKEKLLSAACVRSCDTLDCVFLFLCREHWCLSVCQRNKKKCGRKRDKWIKRLRRTRVQLSKGLQHYMANFRCSSHAVAMTTYVIANLRCSKTKSLSLAVSGREVNHYLHAHTRTQMKQHLQPAKVISRDKKDVKSLIKSSGFFVFFFSILPQAEASFAPFVGFVCRLSHSTETGFSLLLQGQGTNGSQAWRWYGCLKLTWELWRWIGADLSQWNTKLHSFGTLRVGLRPVWKFGWNSNIQLLM